MTHVVQCILFCRDVLLTQRFVDLVAEDADEDAPQPQAPVTFKMLDEHTPTLHVPCTADEPRAKCLAGFPALGGYAAAAAVSRKTGKYTSIVAGDTLVPHGDAAPVAIGVFELKLRGGVLMLSATLWCM